MAEIEAKASESVPSCVLTVFGATGDLMQRLLLPSIYNLITADALGSDFRLLGVAKEDWNDEKMREHVVESLRQFWGADVDPQRLEWLTSRTYYQAGDFKEASTFEGVKRRLEELEGKGAAGDRLFYLAVAPSFIAPIASQLARIGQFDDQGGRWRRLITEKPFGNDYESAVALTSELHKSLREDQIFRIDHFIGKDAVQDLGVFRFSNPIIDPIWNRTLIDHVQITVAETVGLEGRAGFYEKSGALRDMVPSHLAELLSVVAMEPPTSLDAEEIRNRQVDLMSCVRKIQPEEVSKYAVRAQYGSGAVNGTSCEGYMQEQGVAPDSTTETYVAMKIEFENARWSGVPFFLRTGKRLTRALTEVSVKFRDTGSHLLQSSGIARGNEFVFGLAPTQQISLSFDAKVPGLQQLVMHTEMNCDLPSGPFGKHAKGYERLLRDAMKGDVMLFQRADFIERGWQMVQPLLSAWQAAAETKLPVYASGTAGPKEADVLLAQTGHAWRSLGDS